MKAILQSNETYEFRILVWDRIDKRPDSDLIGVMEIRESKSASSKVKISRFAVQEYKPDTSGLIKRIFRLVKPGGQEFYNTAIQLYGERGDSCDCIGFTQHGHCKHAEAMRKLFREGALPQCPAV